MNNNYIKLSWLSLLCIVSVFLAPPVQAFNPQPDPPGAQVGLVDTQTARINVFYGGIDTIPGPCFLEFRVYDATGVMLGRDILPVEPGQAIQYDYSIPIAVGAGPLGAASRTQLRFVVLRPRGIIDPDIRPACRARNRIVTTLEVFDNATGATTLRLNGASIYGFNPQPDPPGRRRRGLFVTDVDD